MDRNSHRLGRALVAHGEAHASALAALAAFRTGRRLGQDHLRAKSTDSDGHGLAKAWLKSGGLRVERRAEQRFDELRLLGEVVKPPTTGREPAATERAVVSWRVADCADIAVGGRAAGVDALRAALKARPLCRVHRRAAASARPVAGGAARQGEGDAVAPARTPAERLNSARAQPACRDAGGASATRRRASACAERAWHKSSV